MKKAIYSVHIGDYDYPPTPALKNEDWDKVLFTDSTEDQHMGWDKVIVVKTTQNPKIESRRYKWLSHKYLKEYDLACYHDANIQVVRELPETPFWVQHPSRNSVLQEVTALKYFPTKVDNSTLVQQSEAYSFEGFTDDVGLFQNGFFCRTHEREANVLCEEVFDNCRMYTTRDQISFPYAVWKSGIVLSNIVSDSYVNYLTRLYPHKPSIRQVDTNIAPKVHHITPGRSDKNFGKAINDIVGGLPENDWICLRDTDTVPLLPSKFIEQCEGMAKNGEFKLISCYTNRLGLPQQLPNGFRDNTDILEEIKIAEELYQTHKSTVYPTEDPIAGIMFLFPKYIWEEVGGFKEGGIIFGNQFIDNWFYERVKNLGYKIGIAKGIYLFHLYRMGKDKKDVEHLLNKSL